MAGPCSPFPLHYLDEAVGFLVPRSRPRSPFLILVPHSGSSFPRSSFLVHRFIIGGIGIGNVTGTLTHQLLINPNPSDKTKTTNPIVQPQRAVAPNSPPHQGAVVPVDQVGQLEDNPVVRRLFKMPDEAGPQIRMPWFHGKPDETVERYLGSLRDLKPFMAGTRPRLLTCRCTT